MQSLQLFQKLETATDRDDGHRAPGISAPSKREFANSEFPAFDSRLVEIHLGNIESTLVGPTPRQALDRALNPHLRVYRGDGDGPPMVYDPDRDVFLTGALTEVKRTLRRAGLRFRLKDFRHSAPAADRWTVTGFELRDYQADVVQRAIDAGSGLVDVGTGGGKTLLAAAIIAELGLPTLFVVTTRTLLRQTVRNLRDMLGVDPGVIGDGRHEPECLTVALIQALTQDTVDLAPWRGGTLVVDEGHHAAATTFQALIRRIEPRNHYYLSAVPWRAGDDQAVLDALAGDGGRLTNGRYSARFLTDHGFACPVEVVVERCRIEGRMAERPFHGLYRDFIVRNPDRNGLIASVVARELRRGQQVLVLVDHVRHGREIERRVAAAAFVHGGTPRRALHETVDSFSDGSVRCLIATAGLFQEGVSISGIECLVLAGGLRSKAKVLQAVGRGMRLAPGKSVCRFIDFYDDDRAGVFRQHSQDRLRALMEEGFAVPRVDRDEPTTALAAPIPATWGHVAGTRFALVDGNGRIKATAECLERSLVPGEICRKCKNTTLCRTGGRIQWREDPA